MITITKEKAEQGFFLRLIRQLDDYIWIDIVRARRSWAIIDVFLRKIRENGNKHFLDKNAPMINALWYAAVDSVIISLGRLLKPGDENESTLAQYRNKVITYLIKYGPEHNESNYARESLKKMRSRDFVRRLKIKQKQYHDQVMPWRDKVTAHTEIKANVGLPNNLEEIITFVEENHRILLSAMEDSGMKSGSYISDAFEDISSKWANCLISNPELI